MQHDMRWAQMLGMVGRAIRKPGSTHGTSPYSQT